MYSQRDPHRRANQNSLQNTAYELFHYALIWFLCSMAYRLSWLLIMKAIFVEVVLINPYLVVIRRFILFTGILVKIIARLEFELAYYDVTVQHVGHGSIVTSPDYILRKPDADKRSIII